jgi:hypothetical protein
MLVDVTFDGVSLAKGANARPDGNNGWFVEVEQPMPVGTLLALSGEAQAMVQVARVVEGVGAGMLLLSVAPVEKGKPADAKPADAKPADAKPAEAAPKKSEKADGDGDDDPEGNSNGAKGSNGTSKGRRRRKSSPSI